MGLFRSATARAAAALRFDGLWWRKFAYLGCVYGPEWWKQGSPPVIAAILFALVGRNRRGAIENMQRILGDGDRAPRRARGAAHVRRVRPLHDRDDGVLRPAAAADPTRSAASAICIAEALREGRGAVLVTGHIGNWDIAAKTLREYDQPINLVMAREANATTQDYVRDMRERAGVRVIYSDTSVFSALNMIRALRQNEIVAIQLDRMLGLGGARAVPFFGAPAPFPSGPFVLARLAGAPLIPVFIPRLGTRHYAVRFGTPPAAVARGARRATRSTAPCARSSASSRPSSASFPASGFSSRRSGHRRAAPAARQRPAGRRGHAQQASPSQRRERWHCAAARRGAHAIADPTSSR